MMRKPLPFTLRRLTLAVTLASLAACSSVDVVEPGPTLENLEPAQLPNPTLPVPSISLDEIERSYREALAVADDPDTRRKILIRLAGLEMARSEEALVNSTAPGRFFDNSIALYKELIELQRNQPATVATRIDELLYQLSKAYALDGRSKEADEALSQLAAEYPDSPFLAEAYFRRAERSFSSQDYRISSDRYQAVVDAGPNTAFFENSLYMLGWSQFKREIYEDAIESFTQLLDVYLVDGSEFEILEGTEKTLAEDTLRVMSLSFSYLEGPATISETYERLGERQYEYLLYQSLANHYLGKERYNDSALTYQAFVDRYPLSDRAPSFSAEKINVYELGGFPDKLVPNKEQYVNLYGINSEYWSVKPESVLETLKPTLHQFLIELAKYRHARAQAWQKALAEKPDQKFLVEDREIDDNSVIEEFILAARWYSEFVQTFPDDPERGEINYLLAEALYDSGQLEAAYLEYERVAYELGEDQRSAELAAEAGYTTVLLAQQLLDRAEAENEQLLWKDQVIASGVRFADNFPSDDRAVAVLTQSAQGYLDVGKLPEAIEAALRVTQWQPQAEPEILKTAWLIAAQGQFDTEQFVASEFSYQQVLGLLSNDDPQRDGIIVRIAASIYQQAQVLIAQDNLSEAVDQLLRVRTQAPNTDIARTSHYDAANYLIDLERWAQARDELIEFRITYPNHSLTPTIGPKLVVVYQALENWAQAAEELLIVMEQDKDPEVQRESLLLVAELFERDGNLEKAIDNYRRYAHTYPDPFITNMEAQFKMSELYVQTGSVDKRNFWLRKMVTTHDRAGEKKTGRSMFLAAWSSNELADQQFKIFSAIELKLPLRSSLNKKRSALEKTLKAYEKALSYDILEVSTQANFQVGEIYRLLSKALLESERPNGLSDLELEQYEILLEEQAYPFEDQAIAVHTSNTERAWNGVYDKWVQASFSVLGGLLPGRFDKPEQSLEVSDEIF
ncbi:tetratricopeptide repeat protein [Sessilibacter corallicola]|uniref:Tetratricopeptide repeat protein n=1 Tax=Sessilibacter corallicola TaxID=2904075 RepID=A0ABQ0ABX6_9GAMM